MCACVHVFLCLCLCAGGGACVCVCAHVCECVCLYGIYHLSHPVYHYKSHIMAIDFSLVLPKSLLIFMKFLVWS